MTETRTAPHITHRAQQPAPAAPGWYYGRTERKGMMIPQEAFHIVPREVIAHRPQVGVIYLETRLDVVERGALIPLDCFQWFGPVPECREG